jgi:hypothetical protein
MTIVSLLGSVLFLALCLWLWRAWKIGNVTRQAIVNKNNSDAPRFYNFKFVELVRIGTGSARIVEVTRQRLRYIDEHGAESFVDLEDCARIFLTLKNAGLFPPGDETDWTELAAINLKFYILDVSYGLCVGLRGALDEPPWFQFLDRRRTQFQFKDYEAIKSELLVPLTRVNWQTWDAC